MTQDVFWTGPNYPNCKYSEKNRNKREVVASAYFRGSEDEPAPRREVYKLVDYCQRQGLLLIVNSCVASAHHALWASTDINDRCRSLLDFLIDTNLNQGNESTFFTFNRKELRSYSKSV